MSSLIELIKVLRDRTGAGMMDCKHALVECNSDVEKAIDWLREKGIAKQAKKASRIAAEGLSVIEIEGNRACVVEVNCETDFVASSDPFKVLVTDIAKAALANDCKTVEELKEAKTASGKTVAELFVDATVKLGEKLDLRRFVILTKNDDEVFGHYVHMKGKISAVTVVKGSEEIAKDLAMSAAANAPTYLSKEDVPAAEIERERKLQEETVKEDASFAKKPEAIQKKILEGKVMKHFASQVFLTQEFVKNPELTVEQALKEAKSTLVSFVRYQVGEGIEKRVDDFAKEVAEQMN